MQLENEIIKLLRLQCGWTQERLSEKSGVSRTEISLLENGRHGMSVAVYRELLGAMGYKIQIARMKGADDE